MCALLIKCLLPQMGMASVLSHFSLFHLAAVLPVMSDSWTFEPFPETRTIISKINRHARSPPLHPPPSAPMHFRNRYITVPLLKRCVLFFITGTHKHASYLDMTESLRARIKKPHLSPRSDGVE